MADTTTTVTPPSSNAQPAAIPTNQLAAVSSAINQAVPPGRNAVQTPAQSADRQTSAAQPQRQPSSDREVSLDDFGEENENPFTPKPSQQRQKVEKQSNGKPAKELAGDEVETENEDASANKDSSTDSEVDDINKESDNKLELDLNVDENADPLKGKAQEQAPKGKRDYSKFKPEHAEILKHVPNALFARASEELTKLYGIEQENTQLKEKLKGTDIGKLPDSYYEHQNGYQLSPKYSELSRELNYDRFEEDHWSQQLSNIERGQDWIRLKGYDNSGNPVYEKVPALTRDDADGNKVPVLDVDSKRAVEKYLTSVRDLSREHSRSLQELQLTHKQEYERSSEGLKGLKQQFFKNFLDESKLPPAIKADLQLARDAIKKQVPAFANNPAMELVIYSYAALKFQNRQILKMAQMLNTEKEKLETTRRAGPGKTDFQGGTTQGDRIISEKDFED